MINITIKNKCYYTISTLIDGKTFRIPSKGKNITINVTKITEHMKELVQKNKIKIIINNK